MPPPYSPELRPYRVTTYAIYFAFTLTFIFLVIFSVWKDLYGKEANRPAGQLSLTACRDEIETLARRLEARLNDPLVPRTARNWSGVKQGWDTFDRKFEDDLGRIQSDCVNASAEGAAGAAITQSTERMDALREHLARCGEEGEVEREALARALQKLGEISRAKPH